MYFAFTVDIPKVPGIVRQTKNGTVYIDYEYERSYVKSKGYTAPRRSTIGKQDPQNPDKMWPNQNYLKFFSDEAFPDRIDSHGRSACLRIGGFTLIRKLFDETGIPALLDEQFDPESKGLIMDFAAYSIISENNAGQYYPAYAYNHPLFTCNMAQYSDSRISSFLREITDDQRIGFLNSWNETRDHREKVYISYDATNKNCQAGEVDFAEFGNAKDDESKPIVNYAVAYNVKDGEPAFYEEYPGSINDVSQLKQMVGKAQGYGYRHIGFILDRGYFDRKNLLYIDECGYDFIIMVKGLKPLVRDMIAEVKGSFERKRAYYIKEHSLAGITVKRKMYESDEKERYFHLYYSLSRENHERRLLEETLRKMGNILKKHEGEEITFSKQYEEYYELFYHEEKGNVKDPDGREREVVTKKTFLFAKERGEAIENEICFQGYFALVTSDQMTAEEALNLYKSRDESEKLFRADKSYLDDAAFRVYSNEAVASKIFIAFIALIIRNRIYRALREEKKRLEKAPNYMTVPAAIRELEKIEMVRLIDGLYRLDHAVTRTQKDILRAFNIDADHVESQALELQGELKRIAEESLKKGA